MRRIYQGVHRDGSGNIIQSGTISVYLTGTSTAASVYTTVASATAVNSVTSDSVDGTFTFYTDDFDYGSYQAFDITLSKSGYIPKTFSNIDTRSVLGTYTVSADKTLASTIALEVPCGVIYSVASGKTLTINGPLKAGIYQIFSGDGSVVFGAGCGTEVRPSWFGVAGDGSTDDSTAFEKALLAASTNGGMTFRTEDGRTYKFGSDGDEEVLFTGSNITYEFGTSTFNGKVVFGPRATSGQTTDVIVNGGIYESGDSHGANADNRYQAWNNCLGVIYGKNITFNNPTIVTQIQTAGMSIQTDTTLGADPFNNISNIVVNNPIITGDGYSPQGLDIACSGAYNNMITDVTVNNPIISDQMRAVVMGHNTGDYHIDRIHINNLSANNISDTAVDCSQAYYSSVSGRVQNVGWRGLYSYKNDYSTFDLRIHGSDALATPSFSGSDPSLSTQVPVGAHLLATAATLPVYFPYLLITGYDTSNKWDYGIVKTGKGAVFGRVELVFCDDGINSDTYQSVYGQVIMDNVTTPLTNAWSANNWFGEIIIPGSPVTKFDTSTNIYTDTVELTNANIKALKASPKELVATPGADRFIEVISVVLILDYGTNVLTESDDNLVVQYGTSGDDITAAIEMTGFIDQAADTIMIAYPSSPVAANAATDMVNNSITLFNSGSGEFAGNASANTTMTVKVNYRKHRAGL